MLLDKSIDTVSDLPVPSLTLPTSSKQQPQAPEPSSPTPPAKTRPVEQPSSSPTRSRAPLRKQSFGDPEADPWGSPDLHRGHNHQSYTSVPAQPNGTSAPTPARTTSNFTTRSAAVSSTVPDNVQPSSLGSEGGWGGYNAPSQQPFAAPGLGDGGFGVPPSRESGANPNPELARSIGRLNPTGTGTGEIITITALSEKEGMFMFQHRNYEVASSRRTTKVVRRYSDFVWLLDCLHKRYPFRQLPLLPPKRVASKSYLCNRLMCVESS